MVVLAWDWRRTKRGREPQKERNNEDDQCLSRRYHTKIGHNTSARPSTLKRANTPNGNGNENEPAEPEPGSPVK